MKLTHILTLGLLALGVSQPQLGLAQTAPLNYHLQSYALDTGVHSSRAGETASTTAFSKVVKVPGAPWIRLTFTDAALGKNSYLVVTSMADGAYQRINADTLAQWKNTSAFFNGDAVQVDLYAGKGDAKVFAKMDAVMVGGGGETDTQCGSTDNRVASTDPRNARLLTVGCTAWLISDGRFVTAGHCVSSAGSANTVEFNVPPSLSNGAIQHPAPEDQYIVNDSTIVFTEGGIGNDWGVFQALPNGQTGLTALQAQGSFYNVVQDLTPPTIRITGYGVDSGTANQTQQTSTGPNAGSSGTTMRYQTDTEGGNSGSPVIDEATGNSVGIHTNGGCSTNGTGSNSGTSNFNTALWAQIGNTGGGDDISLTARAKKRGTSTAVTLRWNPADGGNISVTRNGVPVQTTPDDGNTKDNLGTSTGTFTYQVCETDSGDCSNQAVITVQ